MTRYPHNVDRLTYNSWRGMCDRCKRPTHISFRHYGGRGIRVCDSWESYYNFEKDMGKRPSKNHQIDRIDCDGNYEQSNCRWATRSEQCFNRRQIGRYAGLQIGAKRKSMRAWEKEAAVSRTTLKNRIAAGMDPEKAISMPEQIYRKVSIVEQEEMRRLSKLGMSAAALGRQYSVDPSTAWRIIFGNRK